jgi:hypothetical protein
VLKCLTSCCSKYDFSSLPPEDDEDYIDTGAAQLQFYSSLVDLLGRCAPEAEAITAGRSDSLRARAILRSLVSLEDLEGALGILPVGKTEQVCNRKDWIVFISNGYFSFSSIILQITLVFI